MLEFRSDVIFYERISIEAGHCVDGYHALDSVFGLFCLSGFLLRPDYCKGRVQLRVPVVALGNHDTRSFALHNQCI